MDRHNMVANMMAGGALLAALAFTGFVFRPKGEEPAAAQEQEPLNEALEEKRKIMRELGKKGGQKSAAVRRARKQQKKEAE